LKDCFLSFKLWDLYRLFISFFNLFETWSFGNDFSCVLIHLFYPLLKKLFIVNSFIFKFFQPSLFLLFFFLSFFLFSFISLFPSLLNFLLDFSLFRFDNFFPLMLFSFEFSHKPFSLLHFLLPFRKSFFSFFIIRDWLWIIFWTCHF